MRQRIKNQLLIEVNGVDLTQTTNLELYISQTPHFFQYVPEVMDTNKLVVVIPFEDAMKLKRGVARMQLAFVGPDGGPNASEPVDVPVATLIKEAGYDPS